MIAKKLTRSFFEQPTLKVAENLLGKFLVVQTSYDGRHVGNPRTKEAEPRLGKSLAGLRFVRQSPPTGGSWTKREQSPYVGKIVETEAYIGEDDLACHASKGRTSRSEILYREAGTVYVYLVYGMYHCFNIVTEREHFPSAVLIRAVEPVEGIDLMEKRRKIDTLRNLASGPGKLCMAFGINKELNGKTVFGNPHYGHPTAIVGERAEPRLGKEIWIEDRGERVPRKNIVSAPRVGVDYAKHCKDLPWRFYIKDNPFVSRK